MRAKAVRHEFVEFIPSELVDGVLYISIPYATAVHKCCCGCGEKVVTPFSPTDWKLFFDGETVSLAPSVGNWSFRCQSHYLIQQDKVVWARRMSREEIEAVRRRDRAAKNRWYQQADADAPLTHKPSQRSGVLRRIERWFRRSRERR